MFERLIGLGFVALALAGPPAAAAETLKLGVLKFGTVNWEVDVIKHHALDKAHGFDLEAVAFGGVPATKIALQGGAVDGIVSDWLWVSRQRHEGRPYVMIPYSSAIGAVMVPAGSEIAKLTDLVGKKIGVAGGPLDKNWLLVRGLVQRESGVDLADVAEPAFGAPPLLSQKLADGELDAVITYWHFAARLEAAGFRRLAGMDDVMAELGIEAQIPALGYVFSEAFAVENPDLIAALAAASAEAKAILATDEAEWERLKGLIRAEDEATLNALRARFIEGIPAADDALPLAEAGALFALLAAQGGADLVGDATELSHGTFWQPDAR